jgi:hypothetical protein
MPDVTCPKCGHETAADAPSSTCGHAGVNGLSKPARVKPPPPPEAANWVIEPVPPEVAEHFRQTFNEEEFLAEMRETMKTGGVRFEDIIDEIERIVHGKE